MAKRQTIQNVYYPCSLPVAKRSQESVELMRKLSKNKY
ncbi:UNVERIFIED_ORG: hypothetical protein [Escherichia phage CMSTMSU]